MRQFEKGNWSHGSKCVVCGTSKAGAVVLIPIVGTEDGGTAEAKQVHVECIDLSLQILPDGKVFLFQRLRGTNGIG